jgi:Ricin-type beta-trefoil lectin domain-like/Secretion system C-terminal sorting domain/Bacterial Ig-like domain (group 2)
MKTTFHTFYQRLMLCVLLVLSFTTATVQAQAPAIQWQKVLGGADSESANAVDATTDGGSILVGTTGSSNSGDVGTNHGGADIWVIKLSASGAVQWKKLLGGAADDVGYSVQQTTDGGYIIVGDTHSSNTGDVGSNHGFADVWVVKLNASGTILWQKVLGGSKDDFATSVQQTKDGGYILTGSTQSSNSGDVGLNHGEQDIWVVKLDALGIIQWQKVLGGTQREEAKTIQQTTDGNYIVGGFTTSPTSGDLVDSGSAWGSAWIVKLNASGTILWQKVIWGYSGKAEVNAIQQTTDGGCIVAGYLDSYSYPIDSLPGLSADFWVMKLDALGTVQWEKFFGGEEDDYARSVQQTTDGGYIVSGYTKSSNSGNSGVSIPGNLIVKLNASGNVEWKKSLSDSSPEGFYSIQSIQQSADGSYIFAATTGATSNSGDFVGTNHGMRDIWLVKLAPPCSFTPSVSGSSSVCTAAKIQLTGSAGTARWSSADSTVATVSQTGLVTGVFQGFFNYGRNEYVYQRSVDIFYTVTQGGCTSVVTKSVRVSAPPALPIVVILDPLGATVKGSIKVMTYEPSVSFSLNNNSFAQDYSNFPYTTFNDLTVGTYKLKRERNDCQIEQDVVLKEHVVAFDPNKCYRIVNKSTKKSLAIKDASQAEGAQIYQWSNKIAAEQLWQIKKQADGTYNFVSTSSGKLMDVTDNSPAGYCAEGTIIQQFTADGTSSQKWRIEMQGDRSFKIYNATCNKPLRVENNSFADGANVGIKNDFGTLSFQWLIEEAPCYTALNFDPAKCYRIVNKATNKVLEVKDAAQIDGAQIYQWASSPNRKQQLWQFKASYEFNIIAKNSGKLMDVVDNTAAGYCAEGTIIQQFTADGTYSQKWALEPQAGVGSYFKIRNLTCNKYLRVESGSTADGASVGIKNDFGTDAFIWSLQLANCTTGAALSATSETFAFEARASEGRAKLQWITNTGFKNDYFEVERLNANGSFEVLNRLNTEGGTELKSYTFTDNDPLEGDNFYRINAISNGNTPPQYSEVKKVSFSKNDGISVFPNPADDYINIDLRKYEGQRVALSFYNSVGLMVKKQTIEKVSAAPQRVDMQGFGTGSYLLRVQSEGKREVTRLFNITK